MRHGQARSWLRARAGSRAASARTRASQWPGPAAARGAPVRIDFGEQNRRASERAAAKMGERVTQRVTPKIGQKGTLHASYVHVPCKGYAP